MDDLGLEAWSIVEELAQSVVREYCRRYGRNGPKIRPGEQRVDPNTNVKTTVGWTSGVDKPSTPKRAHWERNNDDFGGDKDEDDSVPAPKRTKDIDGEPMRLFACPYAKFDPQRYSEHNQTEKKYRKCSSKYLKDVTRVKQHLYRTHKRPDWYCGNCYQHFEFREELNAHAKRRPPCDEEPVKYEEMMTDTQYTLVKRRSQGNSDRESWYRVYETLFPGAPRPLSPYVSSSDPAVVGHFVTFFQWFGPQRYLDIVRTHRERNAGSFQLEASTQAVIDEALEVAIPNYLIQSDSNSESEEQLGNTLVQVDGRASSNTQPLEPPYEDFGSEIHHPYQATDALFDRPESRAETTSLGSANQYQIASHGPLSSGQTPQPLSEQVVNMRELHPQEFQPFVSQLDQTFGMYDMLEDFSAYSLPGTDPNHLATHISPLS